MKTKKLFSLLLVLLISATSISADQEISVVIDGTSINFTQDIGMPFIDDNNRTLVPFRASMEAIDANVSWDSTNQVATATKNDVQVEVPIGKDYILINDVKKQNDTKAVIVEDRTYLPIRIVMESFGYSVDWNQDNQSVLITNKKVTQTNEPVQAAFGIRHDRKLSEYQALATSNNPELPDFSPLVSFQYSLDGSDNMDFIATGTLIAPQWVLTAGHNFYLAEEQDSPAKPEGIIVAFGPDPNQPLSTHSVEKIVFHPTWINNNDSYFYGNDYALVKLSKPVTGVTPAKLYKEDKEPLGSVVWFAGFGDYSQAPSTDTDLYANMHAVKNILDRKASGLKSTANGKTYYGGVLAFDFDDPTGQTNSLGDNYVGEDEQELGTGTSDNMPLDFEGSTVEGDSGGPLFIKSGNEWKIAGLLSGGAYDPIENHVENGYGDISIFMRVSTQIKWIERVISEQ